MTGLLLDTHVLLWLVAQVRIGDKATIAINEAQIRNQLYISPISAWEIGAGLGKKNPNRRPHLQGLAPNVWFTQGVKLLAARVPPITVSIAAEASLVPAVYEWSDPGDCLLIATARVRKLSLSRETRG